MKDSLLREFFYTCKILKDSYFYINFSIIEGLISVIANLDLPGKPLPHILFE